jgi:serine O-acetyltransferase
MRFDAVALHRVAQRLATRGVPIVPRAIDWLIFLLFDSKISHTTQIGHGTSAAYRGMSVLIHTDAVIGKDVVIGPHVVIGGRSGHAPPRIGDRAYLGANAVVLSDVGEDVVVGAGAVVLHPVAAGHAVAGNPARSLGDPRTSFSGPAAS